MRRSKGLSLLEALVSLVIVALIATLLVQSLLQILAIRERILRVEAMSRETMLVEAWFRDSVIGLVAEMPGNPQRFAGDAEGWSGWSSMALMASGQRGISWRIVEQDGEPVLAFAVEGQSPRTLRRVGPGARFHYIDAAGSAHDRWPVEAVPQEALPRAVIFVDDETPSGTYWFAHVGAGPGLPQSIRFSEDVRLEPGI